MGRIGKDCTEDLLALDVRQLQRGGMLAPGYSGPVNWTRRGQTVATINLAAGAGGVTLKYRLRERGGEWRPLSHPVRLDRTACNFGGGRAWWLCPCCGRRVAVLYIGGSGPACRHCYRLAYRSQRETHSDRAGRRADTLRARLGWEPGILNGSGDKPKGMHWRTYWRLRIEHDTHALRCLNGLAEKFGIV